LATLLLVVSVVSVGLVGIAGVADADSADPSTTSTTTGSPTAAPNPGVYQPTSTPSTEPSQAPNPGLYQPSQEPSTTTTSVPLSRTSDTTIVPRSQANAPADPPPMPGRIPSGQTSHAAGDPCIFGGYDGATVTATPLQGWDGNNNYYVKIGVTGDGWCPNGSVVVTTNLSFSRRVAGVGDAGNFGTELDLAPSACGMAGTVTVSEGGGFTRSTAVQVGACPVNFEGDPGPSDFGTGSNCVDDLLYGDFWLQLHDALFGCNWGSSPGQPSDGQILVPASN